MKNKNRPIPPRNENITKFKNWEQWQEISEKIIVEVKKGKYKGCTIEVFEHYNDDRYYCICNSIKGPEIEIIKKEYV